MIGTWARNLIILLLAGYIIFDMSVHAFSDGYKLGLQHGFQQGLNQPPQVWKSDT